MMDELVCNRLDRRRRKFLDAARKLFCEQGFERTTLGDVVIESGGSLATIYKLFGNKEGLLEAVAFDKAQPGGALIREIGESESDPATALRRMARALHDRFLDPADIALIRVVLARNLDDRSFAERFYAQSALPTRMALESVFARWQAEGHPLSGHPALLAEVFLGMIFSELHVLAISHGSIRLPAEADIDARTEFFLRGAGLAPVPEATGAERP